MRNNTSDHPEDGGVRDGSNPIDSRTRRVHELTLMLMYLTASDESTGKRIEHRASTGYDLNALQALKSGRLIKLRAAEQFAVITGKGMDEARRLVQVYEHALEDLERGAEGRLSQLDPLDVLKLMIGGEAMDPVISGRRTASVGSHASRAKSKSRQTSDKPAYAVFDETDRRAFRFHVQLDLYEHVCWREVLVPATYTFLDLHVVLQYCFNWLDYHLWNFTLKRNGQALRIDEDEVLTGEPADWQSPFALSEESIRADEMHLNQIFPQTRTALYSYDYGDGWEHKVRLLGTLNDAGLSEPQLLDGQGDAPPEDVGAEPGFDSFLNALADESHPEHAFMLEWGKDQQFRHFDLSEAQEHLADWGFDRLIWAQRLAESPDGD